MINNGLKGSDVLALNCLETDNNLSIYQIADMINYHPITVWRALRRLKKCGVLVVHNHGRGRRNSYEVKR